jgi:MFS superfamily sulfate permease-like transporter
LKSVKKIELLKFIPAPLVIVVASVLFNEILLGSNSSLAIEKEHLVSLPILNHPFEIMGVLKIPNWSAISDSNVWIIGFTIALVASLESLLSLEAVDDLDPEKRFSFPNKELVAQGAGNLVSGLLGGLPVTSVIVRSSANVNAGGRTKLSAILHGFFLLISILFLGTLLNKIPLAALASILIYTGYKLAKISLFKEYYRKGWDQFIPFLVTIIAIVLTDLLKGITIGILVGLFYTFRSNFKSSVFIIKDEYRYLMRFRKDVSFLNKSLIKRTLANIPDDSALILDPTKAEFIDKDVIDVVNDFLINAESRNIRVYIKKKPGKEDIFERQNQLDFKN